MSKYNNIKTVKTKLLYFNNKKMNQKAKLATNLNFFNKLSMKKKRTIHYFKINQIK